MTSARRAEANRKNARRSTGPRTPEGKARAAKNAIRHGLNTPLEANDALPSPFEELADLLCSDDHKLKKRARAAALAQAELMRVQTAKLRILQLAAFGCEVGVSACEPASAEVITAKALIEHAGELLKLDVYERKARSRRKKAFRAL